MGFETREKWHDPDLTDETWQAVYHLNGCYDQFNGM